MSDEEIITFPEGILGFPQYKRYCLVDSGDETLILWLQSVENPDVAFAVLEPKIFKADYTARLSAAELRELKLENVNQSAVFSILTIPEDATLMTANLKAPIVINLKDRVARQVVLQENEYNVKHPMFKELRAHLLTIQSAQSAKTQAHRASVAAAPVAIRDIPPSLTVKSLSA